VGGRRQVWPPPTLAASLAAASSGSFCPAMKRCRISETWPLEITASMNMSGSSPEAFARRKDSAAAAQFT
jgi:hypothetical protein